MKLTASDVRPPNYLRRKHHPIRTEQALLRVSPTLRFVFPKHDGLGEFRKIVAHGLPESRPAWTIVHGLRRSAVRHFARSGIPQSIAMQLSGHRTAAILRRYDVASEEDLLIAAHLLEEATAKVKFSVK